MKSSPPLYIIASLLMIAPSLVFCLADDADKEPTTAPQFILGLSDGSKLVCTPILKSVRIITAYAKLDVPVDRITKVLINRKEKTAAVHMKNGDLLKGKLDLQMVKVKAVFGTVSISMDHIVDMVESKTAVAEKVNDTPGNRSACINNLRIIDSAKAQWALEQGARATDIPNLGQIADYIKDTNKLFCPAITGTNRNFKHSYEMNAINMRPTCKILPETKDGSPHHSLHYTGSPRGRSRRSW